MRTEQLQYLLELKRTGSISQAAQQNFISHQGISKAMQALEKELGVTLFQRTSKGILFTKAGEACCNFAKKMEEERVCLEEQLMEFRPSDEKKEKIKINLYAIPRYSTPIFYKFLQAVQLHMPQIEPALYHTTNEAVFSKLQFDETTIAFMITYDTPPQEDALLLQFVAQNHLDYRLLHSDLLYGCVHKSSPLAKKEQLSPSNDVQVAFTYTSHVPLSEHYRRPQFIIDSFEQQKTLLKQGKCFGIYTEWEYQAMFAKGYVKKPLSIPCTIHFIALYKQQGNQNIALLLNEYQRFFFEASAKKQ